MQDIKMIHAKMYYVSICLFWKWFWYFICIYNNWIIDMQWYRTCSGFLIKIKRIAQVPYTIMQKKKPEDEIHFEVSVNTFHVILIVIIFVFNLKKGMNALFFKIRAYHVHTGKEHCWSTVSVHQLFFESIGWFLLVHPRTHSLFLSGEHVANRHIFIHDYSDIYMLKHVILSDMCLNG